MKKVKISQKELNNIIRETINSIIYENYVLEDTDELMEYMWLRPQVTNLNVDIFVDDGGSYKRHNHKLILYARNGYVKSVSEFIPFLISNIPIVLDKTIDYKINYNDIFAVQDFIQANLKILKELADKKITQTAFYNCLQIPSYSLNLNECKEFINEMATLRMSDSKLPMDIWLDEGGTFMGHAPRLKFRASNEQRTTREFTSMLLTNPPTIENMPQNTPLKKKDIEKLKEFVINNLDLLLSLAKGEIDYINGFLPNIIK